MKSDHLLTKSQNVYRLIITTMSQLAFEKNYKKLHVGFFAISAFGQVRLTERFG